MFDNRDRVVSAASDPGTLSPAEERFTSCRWRQAPEQGSPYCSHRDVLPLAGTSGFKPEAWCPDCTFYKLRRTPKKKPPHEYSY